MSSQLRALCGIIFRIFPLFVILILTSLFGSLHVNAMDNTHISENDEALNYVTKTLMMIEGMEVNSSEVQQLAQVLFEALGSSEIGLSSSELFKEVSSVSPDIKAHDIFFVYGLFALVLEGQPKKALEKLNQYTPKLTYMDELPSADNKVLEFAYAWLINNTEVTVPCWFVQKYPDIYYNGTPFWGSTRDRYFSVCTPDSWQLENLPGYSELLDAIGDAFNPGDCNMGSIGNGKGGKGKVVVHQEGLIANRPDYYLQLVPVNNRINWLDYWQYLGPYNYGVVKRIRKATSKVHPALADMLYRIGGLSKSEAQLTSEVYLNNLIANAIGWSYKPYEAYLDEYKTNGWKKWDSPPDREYLAEIIGGYLLYNRPVDEFISYVSWLNQHNSWEVIYSLMNTTAAISTNALERLLSLRVPFPERWGAFNKSPLLYAVQYNNHESYNLLKSIEEMNTITLLDDDFSFDDCEVPQIAHRNVLTYAAENADEQLLLHVVEDFSKIYGGQLDTEGRSVKEYLLMNASISVEGMQNVLQALQTSSSN